MLGGAVWEENSARPAGLQPGLHVTISLVWHVHVRRHTKQYTVVHGSELQRLSMRVVNLDLRPLEPEGPETLNCAPYARPE
jgi:hypothetical protein